MDENDYDGLQITLFSLDLSTQCPEPVPPDQNSSLDQGTSSSR